MTILLKNGIVLSHGADDHVTALHNTDVLIEGNKIVKIGKSLASADETIDCTHKIISPGFVDTHHHMWQTQLKGRHADETLLQYMISGEHPLVTASHVSPTDAGQATCSPTVSRPKIYSGVN